MIETLAWLYALVNLSDLWETIRPVCLLMLWYVADVYCYHITSVDQFNIVMNHIKHDWSWCRDEDHRPYGLIIDSHLPPRYILYRSAYDREIYVYTTEMYYKTRLSQPVHHGIELQPQIDIVDQKLPNQDIRFIRMICRKGNQSWAGYREMTVTTFPDFGFTTEQANMFHKVMIHYNEVGFAKVLLSGPMRTGKTSFAYLLARELQTSLCVSFNPTEPSDSLPNLCSVVDHSPQKPLVILLDEVDQILENITQGIPRHKKYLIAVRNKQHWNDMMDQIQWGIYKNIILIMTTNKSVKTLKAYDPSYIRPGRMNFIFELNSKIQ